MKISIGADHGGVNLKNSILAHLQTQEGYEITDHGTHNNNSVDYPDYAQLVGNDVASGHAEFGVLVCTTGIGMSISANKIPGVRAALVHCEEDASVCREHNNANIIVFGEKHDSPEQAQKYLETFLRTPFDSGGRHERRVGKFERCRS